MGFGNDGVGEQVQLRVGDVCVVQDLVIPLVEGGIVDVFSNRIEFFRVWVLSNELVISRSAIFCEVVNMQEEGSLGIGQVGKDLGKRGVFPKGGVVNVPEVGRRSELFAGLFLKFVRERCRICCEIVRVGVVESWMLNDLSVNVVKIAEVRECIFNDPGYTSRAVMVVQKCDSHSGGGRL